MIHENRIKRSFIIRLFINLHRTLLRNMFFHQLLFIFSDWTNLCQLLLINPIFAKLVFLLLCLESLYIAQVIHTWIVRIIKHLIFNASRAKITKIRHFYCLLGFEEIVGVDARANPRNQMIDLWVLGKLRVSVSHLGTLLNRLRNINHFLLFDSNYRNCSIFLKFWLEADRIEYRFWRQNQGWLAIEKRVWGPLTLKHRLDFGVFQIFGNRLALQWVVFAADFTLFSSGKSVWAKVWFRFEKWLVWDGLPLFFQKLDWRAHIIKMLRFFLFFFVFFDSYIQIKFDL